MTRSQLLKSVPHTRSTGCKYMLSKIAFLFLGFIAVLGMFGKLHWIGGKRIKSAQCKSCGRYRIGRGPCPCKKKDT